MVQPESGQGRKPESEEVKRFRTMLLDRFKETPSGAMSKWYDLLSMFRTVGDISVSEIFRERVDYRTLAALSHQNTGDSKEQEKGCKGPRFISHGSYFEYEAGTEGDSLWFDYAADTGDGFNSTYWVAYQLAQEKLKLRQRDPQTQVSLPKDAAEGLPRGRFLILGGDQVYPSASRDAYETRFVKPYEAASYTVCPPDRLCAPHLFAVPGNHDWYDGLASFMNIFCERRAIGGWRTAQQISYFAIKLPHDVWIFAIDIGLGGELDEKQVCYFQDLVRFQMPEKDKRGSPLSHKIILCIAEPDWVKARSNVANLRDGLFYLERKIAQVAFEGYKKGECPAKDVRVVLRLAGDLHHYRRHESEEPQHPTEDEVGQLGPVSTAETRAKIELLPDGRSRSATKRTIVNITAGGGGAFLHPTHETNRRYEGGRKSRDIEQHPRGLDSITFSHRSAFPSIEESKRLTWWNLLFFRWNMTLSVVLTLCVYGPVLQLGYFLLQVHDNEHRVWESPSPRSMVFAVLLWAVITAALVIGCSRFAANSATGELGESKQGRARRVHASWSSSRLARIWGGLHGLMHSLILSPFFFGGWFVYSVFVEPPIYQWLKGCGILFLVPFVVALMAAVVMAFLSLSLLGGYLLVSLNSRLHLHNNDAFASLRIQDYKNFLRINVLPDRIVVYAIGIEKVPRSWRFLAEDTSSEAWDELKKQALAAKPTPGRWQSLFLPRLGPDGSTEAQACEPFLIEQVTVLLNPAQQDAASRAGAT